MQAAQPLAGHSATDLSNGRLPVSYATDAASGRPFIYIPATTYSWNGRRKNWATASNWYPNGAPGAADTANVASGDPATRLLRPLAPSGWAVQPIAVAV
jgi:hypothetical protein